jgi:aryl-alcohol dehydrogenase-like predicted oxidoreductase
MAEETRQMTVEQRVLGRTGLKVSALGFGAEAIGRRGRGFEDAERTLNAVLDMGITLIDTASAYGNSEEFIGRAISARKGEFTVITKCGWTGDWEAAWSSDQLAATIDLSRRKLQADRLDVLLLHSCGLDELKKGDVINAVIEARDQGTAQFIGYSGDNEGLKYAIESDVFDVVECSFNILDQANAPMIAEAQRRNIGVLIKRPIANAVPGRTEKPRSDYAAQYWPRCQAFEDICNLGQTTGFNWLDVATRFSAHWPGVTSILVGSSHAEHMKQNLDVLNQGPLDQALVDQLCSDWKEIGRDWPALG